MPKAALYHYFPTEQEMFDAMVLDILDRQFATVDGWVADSDDPAVRSVTPVPGDRAGSRIVRRASGVTCGGLRLTAIVSTERDSI